jgi:hypothetical protein
LGDFFTCQAIFGFNIPRVKFQPAEALNERIPLKKDFIRQYFAKKYQLFELKNKALKCLSCIGFLHRRK